MSGDFAELSKSIIDFLLLILPIVGPFLLFYLLFQVWVEHRRREFLNKQEHILLELVPPADFKKSPASMELFLNSLYNTSKEADWFEKYWEGGIRPWFSLEIASIEGRIHYYIWTRVAAIAQVESRLYAEFPGIEVIRQDKDYALAINPTEENGQQVFGIEYKLGAPDPYPIRTYVDYGLDMNPDDEYKIDPLTHVLEYLANAKKGEQFWLQIIIRAHAKEDPDPKKWFGTMSKWQEDAKSEIKKIQEESLVEVGEGEKRPNKTKGQDLKIASLERSVSKLSFDTGIRMLYVAEKDNFTPVLIGGLVSIFRPFTAPESNQTIKLAWRTDVDYPWQDIRGKQVAKMKKEILEAYKLRDYFWKNNWKGKPRKKFVLNTEELATIFHFPGLLGQPPSFQSVDSKKGSPPTNLPI